MTVKFLKRFYSVQAIWCLLLTFLFLPFKGNGFEKLSENFLISLGNPDAKTKVVEYFSLSCPLCLKLLKEEFPRIYNEHISNSNVFWTFHPDPQDITTVQLMVCLEKIPEEKKWKLFWEIVSSVKPLAVGRNTYLIQEISKQFGLNLPLLHDTNWIEKTTAFQEAFEYIKQKDAPNILPAIEVNGTLLKELPTREFLDKVLL